MSNRKNPNSEEAQHVRTMRAGKRPRKKHSDAWEKLKKVRREGRESKDDGVYRRQITLGEEATIPGEHRVVDGVLVCVGHMCDLDGTNPNEQPKDA